MRAALALDLDAPTALAAVDAWAGASTAIDSDDTDAPALVARACEALLGVTLYLTAARVQMAPTVALRHAAMVVSIALTS